MEWENVKNTKNNCVHALDPTYKILKVTYCGLDADMLAHGEKSVRPVTCRRCIRSMEAKGVKIDKET
jgi:hypothetical protein